MVICNANCIFQLNNKCDKEDIALVGFVNTKPVCTDYILRDFEWIINDKIDNITEVNQ